VAAFGEMWGVPPSAARIVERRQDGRRRPPASPVAQSRPQEKADAGATLSRPIPAGPVLIDRIAVIDQQPARSAFSRWCDRAVSVAPP